ncbi:unnamed protein product [Linum trigynum]|uniref:Uncharacterized protein n=1 Tax=Linum trigynum TaxID=586398 RepID=A0AAV2EVE4_9ROSI
MYSFHNPVFKEHATEAGKMKNPPNAIPPQIWWEMVRKWSNPSWVDTSDKNKENREKCELKSTCGSAPLAKYRLEEIKKTGREPNPIETFRKFYSTKDNFTTPKAQALHAGMKAKEVKKLSKGEDVNNGLDVFGSTSSQGCNKKCKEDQRIEKEKSDEKMRMMEKQIEQVNRNMPLVVEATLKRLGIQLPKSSNAANNNDMEDDEEVDGEEEDDDSEDDEEGDGTN